MADGQQELVPVDEAALPADRPDYDLEGLTFAQRVALDPTIDIERLNAVIAMENASQDRAAEKEFERAFAQMQPELPAVSKEGEGHNSAKYAKLEDIQAAMRLALKEYGFSVRFKVTDHDSDMAVTCVLSHSSGHSDEDTIRLPYETSGSKNNVQARGSTVAYGKRYTLCNILGIQTGGDDNDGNGALSGATLNTSQIDTIKGLLKTLDGDEETLLQWAASKGYRALEVSNLPFESFETIKGQLDFWIKKRGANDQ